MHYFMSFYRPCKPPLPCIDNASYMYTSIYIYGIYIK